MRGGQRGLREEVMATGMYVCLGGRKEAEQFSLRSEAFISCAESPPPFSPSLPPSLPPSGPSGHLPHAAHLQDPAAEQSQGRTGGGNRSESTPCAPCPHLPHFMYAVPASCWDRSHSHFHTSIPAGCVHPAGATNIHTSIPPFLQVACILLGPLTFTLPHLHSCRSRASCCR